jgi:hypothetical protein
MLLSNRRCTVAYHDTRVNNVFTFGPDGTIVFACINYPGSCHDSQVAVSLFKIVLERIGNYVDQGFPRQGDLYDKLVGPLSKKARRNLAPRLRRVMTISTLNSEGCWRKWSLINVLN